jgi:hypothetical protein
VKRYVSVRKQDGELTVTIAEDGSEKSAILPARRWVRFVAANYFAAKYRDLYACVNYDYSEMQEIKQEDNVSILQDTARDDFVVTVNDVLSAIYKLNSGKSDGNGGLCTDHFKNSCGDLHVYLSFLFSSMLLHDAIPNDFTTSTVIPIPKGKNINLSWP